MNHLFVKFNSICLLLLSLSLATCQNPSGKGGKVSVDEFEKILSATKDAQLIDVRTPEEFESGHLKNAVNIDFHSSGFETKIKELDRSKTVFVYCLSGGRSGSAASFMREQKFKTVYEMPGIMAWRNAGKELVTDSKSTAKSLTTDEYQKLVTSDKYILVDFSAVWCKPCKQLAPILEKISTDKKEKLNLLKLDADENADLLKQKGIDGIPYLELYKNGKLIWKHQGFIDEENILSETKL